MRVTIDVDGTPHDVELAQAAGTATLADLVEQVCGQLLAAADEVWVDERKHAASDRLADVTLLEGSRVGRDPLSRTTPVTSWTATVSGGLDAGRVVPLPRQRALTIGRAPLADITVDSPSTSWNHASLTLEEDGVRVRDVGSTNGTVVEGERVATLAELEAAAAAEAEEAAKAEKTGVAAKVSGLRRKDEETEEPEPIVDGVLVTEEAVVLVGGAAITLRRKPAEPLAPAPGSLNNVTPSGTAPFNRPPRPGRPPAPEEITPPVKKDDPAPSRFPLATVIGPLVLAVAMVFVLGNAKFALIAGLSPILGIGTYYEQKRRRTKEIEEEETRFAEALETFASDIAEAAAAERARRRAELPDPATTIRRAALPSTLMWQRRFSADDFLKLNAGVGDVGWAPPIDDSSNGKRLHDAAKKTIRASILGSAPVEVDLGNAGVVGIVGDREGALAVARSLVAQAAVHVGPADLTIGVFCDRGRDADWSWTQWLPHSRRLGDSAGGHWLSDDRSRSEAMLRGLRDNVDRQPTPAVLLVLDSDVLLEGRNAPARTLLGHGRRISSTSPINPNQREVHVAGIVVASSHEQLPSSCTVVLEVQPDALGTATRPDDLTTVDDVVLAGLDLPTARRCALDLARFDDPELVVPGAALPSMVRLPPLLGIEEISREAIRESWRTSTRIKAPIGVGETGGFELDLVRDGPHGLVGGTTGSGKSEFLRSLVAGLAARTDPTRLTFILIDFKGGAAFAACERLPHTIGTVSNLDAQLADRAIRALEAEMRYRQEMFAAAGEGVDNLDAYLATNPAEPMPRLLLVVDEFAMLAKEYPDVLSSLVSVGAVGRTLGVHMILATQRPAGVVNDDILANTNLRVALRVQSGDDSSNVIGVPTASAIGRTQMGRAFVKLGQDDITPVQTALVTGRAQAESSTVVEAHPLGFGVTITPEQVEVDDKDAPTDLDLLIDAIVEANDEMGYAPPRPVWPEALGERVELAGPYAPALAEPDPHGPAPLPVVGSVEGGRVLFAISDEPDRQRQIPAAWDLGNGNALMMGIPGSGTSTALATIGLTVCAATSPEDVDLLVMDLGSRDLAPLRDLPHLVGYVGSGAAAREEQVRLLKYVRAELDRRRASSGPYRRLVVLIDGLATLRDEYDDYEGIRLLEGLYRAWTDGPDLGMHFVASTARVKAVPPAIDEVTTQKWLFRLADAYDYSTAGVPAKLAPPPVPGRCVLAETKLQTHVATPAGGLAAAVEAVRGTWSGAQRKATVIGRLPEVVSVADLGVGARIDTEPWLLPVGIAEADLGVAALELWQGEHVMVTGPARSGKSTLLLAMAETIRTAATAAGTPVAIWGVCGRRSPLGDAGLDKVAVGDEDLAALLATARVHRGQLVLLIDDAEQLDDRDQAITGLLDAKLPGLTVIAAGRSDDLRGMYSHWSKTVRKSRCGVLLMPNVDFDGDLLGVSSLPRKAPVALTVGRGYAVSGGAVGLVQTATPTPAPAAGEPAVAG